MFRQIDVIYYFEFLKDIFTILKIDKSFTKSTNPFSFFFLWWRGFFVVVFVELFVVIVSVLVKIFFVIFVIDELVLFKLLVSISIESVKDFKFWKALLGKKVLVKNPCSVVIKFGDWVVSKIDFLQMFKFWKDFEALKFGYFVLVEDQLAQILVVSQFSELRISQPELWICEYLFAVKSIAVKSSSGRLSKEVNSQSVIIKIYKFLQASMAFFIYGVNLPILISDKLSSTASLASPDSLMHFFTSSSVDIWNYL